MDAMEGSGEYEEVVATEFRKAGVKFTIVYQAAGLVDDEKRKHDPAPRQLRDGIRGSSLRKAHTLRRCSKASRTKVWRDEAVGQSG
jgi:hypothetical protein